MRRRLFWRVSHLRLGSVSWGRLQTCVHNKRAYKMDGRTDGGTDRACSIFHVELLEVWSQRDVHVPELQYLSLVTVGTISGVLVESVGVAAASLAQKRWRCWRRHDKRRCSTFMEHLGNPSTLWMTVLMPCNLFQKFCMKTWVSTIFNGNIVNSRIFFFFFQDGKGPILLPWWFDKIKDQIWWSKNVHVSQATLSSWAETEKGELLLFPQAEWNNYQYFWAKCSYSRPSPTAITQIHM